MVSKGKLISKTPKKHENILNNNQQEECLKLDIFN